MRQQLMTPVTVQHATTEEPVSQRITDIRTSLVDVPMAIQGHNVRKRSPSSVNMEWIHFDLFSFQYVYSPMYSQRYGTVYIKEEPRPTNHHHHHHHHHHRYRRYLKKFFFLQQANTTPLQDPILVNHTLAITVAPVTQIMLITETTTAVVHIDIRVKTVTTILLVTNTSILFLIFDV